MSSAPWAALCNGSLRRNADEFNHRGHRAHRGAFASSFFLHPPYFTPMTLGRTSSGAIKVKTDNGLRAVGCACCGPQDFQPCRDCPPLLANFSFSLTGDQVGGLTEFQYPPIVCPSDNCTQFPDIPPRTCSDSWDAFSGTNPTNYKAFAISINRATTNGGLSGCCWGLFFQVQGYFEFEFMGYPDICAVNGSSIVNINSLNPAGSYPFTFSAACVPPFMGPPTDFNFTVTVS